MNSPRLLHLPRLKPYICTPCLRRTLTTLTTLTKNPPSPPSTAYAHLRTRRLLSLRGPDATHFLNGVITANLIPSVPRYAAFLNAQGRLLYDVFLYPDGDEGWLIEVDAEQVDKLARHVKRYKLRAKFAVRVVEEGEMRVWSAWDEQEGGEWTRHGMKGGSNEAALGWEDKRAPGMGRRIIGVGDEKPEVEGEQVAEDVYTVRRYLRGVAEGQKELVFEQALVQESNVDFMGGVNYRKGCYVGQELTIRTHHTGVVRKRILPVMLYGVDEREPERLEYEPLKEYKVPGDTSIGRVEKRGRSAGRFLTGVGNVGLGLCRLETMTDVQVQGEAGGYKEGDEFKLEWEVEGGGSEMVKLKSFVPSWHLRKQ